MPTHWVAGGVLPPNPSTHADGLDGRRGRANQPVYTCRRIGWQEGSCHPIRLHMPTDWMAEGVVPTNPSTHADGLDGRRGLATQSVYTCRRIGWQEGSCHPIRLHIPTDWMAGGVLPPNSSTHADGLDG